VTPDPPDQVPRAEHPGLVVELAGIPGSGKSRRVRALAECLTARGIVVRTPQARLGPSTPRGLRLTRKAAACGAAAVGSPATTARMVRAVHRSGQSGPADLAGRIVQWLVAQHVTSAGRGRPGVTLVDEGLIQCLWSIGLRGDVEPVLSAVTASHRVHAPDLVVVTRVAPELAAERLSARSSRHSRTQFLPEADRLAELQRGDRLLGHLVDWWSRTVPTPIYTIPGTDDDAADRELLISRICASLDGRRSRGGAA
jgi:hypothetical protein